ncbi:MAG: H4MPT-linked C1 transfer pathway protein [Candidatus Bathyarchaeota archaeon]|nr:H4MPT-linked C1 transfer pathway protein [Candidatus Bathyarchaeota archaeon]MCX8177828.1 H4MPT-linked C1 transfer pathway protein [Candidatus Bathyarchaeota archaeon]MDW8193634.1 hydantoinase/oxoprolinase family protein [Nitrososphaerota archaeon]
MRVLGFDVGGANTKAALVETENRMVKELKTCMKYFPIWKMGRDALPEVLRELACRLVQKGSLDCLAVTMTAELSDAYQTKREGVNHILDCVAAVFPSLPVQVLTVEAQLVTVDEARRSPLQVASANWAATGWMASRLFSNCIVVDVGSTSTSIVPVVDGKTAAEGKTDMEKLACGELVYTGALRTNVAAIVSHIPFRGRMLRVSSELFAQSGDVHLVLGNIGMAEYTVDTADGRGKTGLEAMARLARVICADIEMLSQDEIRDMARYIYERQVEQIAQALMQVYLRVKRKVKGNVPILVTGIGARFLGRRAAEQIGAMDVVDLAGKLGPDAAAMTPSVGVALMAAEKLEGGVRWRLW